MSKMDRKHLLGKLIWVGHRHGGKAECKATAKVLLVSPSITGFSYRWNEMKERKHVEEALMRLRTGRQVRIQPLGAAGRGEGSVLTGKPAEAPGGPVPPDGDHWKSQELGTGSS